MREMEQEIIDGISAQITRSLVTCGAYYREDYHVGGSDHADDRLKELKDRVQRLREIRQQLEDLFAGV